MLGTYKRKYPRGIIMRGWDPQNPTHLSISLPVAKDATGRPVQIWQGMLMTPDATNGTHWEVGVSTAKNTAKNTAALAFAQNDSTDFDVVEANKLVGLLCSGKYRFGTPFFARQKCTGTVDNPVASGAAYSYKIGTKLTYAVNGEVDMYKTLVNGVWTNVGRLADGFVRPATGTEPVIGVVAETHSGVNGAATGANAPVSNGSWPLQQSIGTAVDSTSDIDQAYFVVYDTTFAPTL